MTESRVDWIECAQCGRNFKPVGPETVCRHCDQRAQEFIQRITGRKPYAGVHKFLTNFGTFIILFAGCGSSLVILIGWLGQGIEVLRRIFGG